MQTVRRFGNNDRTGEFFLETDQGGLLRIGPNGTEIEMEGFNQALLLIKIRQLLVNDGTLSLVLFPDEELVFQVELAVAPPFMQFYAWVAQANELMRLYA